MDPNIDDIAIFNMVFNDTLKPFDVVPQHSFHDMVHTIGEFYVCKCVENILKKHFENFRMF